MTGLATVRRIATTMALLCAAGSMTVATAQAQDPGPYSNCGVILEGQSGSCVERLQGDLNDVNSTYNLPLTGFFGELTRIAVLDYQGRNGLPADGNAGPDTQAALFAEANSNGSVPSPTPEESSVDPEESTDGGGNGGECVVVNEDSDVLAERYGVHEFAGMMEYLTGEVPPPPCFPYQPTVKATDAGQRALDPFGDVCSNVPDGAPSVFDARNACLAHDYAYDLLRYGVDTFREPTADDRLMKDMKADCDARSVLVRPLCYDAADHFRAAFVGGVFGNVSPGDEIDDK